MNDRELFGDALRYIKEQLKYGYIDLGLHDEIELGIIKQAIEEYVFNHNLEEIYYDA